VFDVAECNVAPVAKQQIAAHPAGISLDFQEQIEVILRQSVAGYPVLPFRVLAGLG
jgi:hypothetical protein